MAAEDSQRQVGYQLPARHSNGIYFPRDDNQPPRICTRKWRKMFTPPSKVDTPSYSHYLHSISSGADHFLVRGGTLHI
jgi:hypothetical protein